jgi:hypothetical protein
MKTTSLVEAAINYRRSWKQVGADLTDLPPDNTAANSVVLAYREGSCEPWMAAYLLGCIGAPEGYEAAREILVSDCGSLSGSYASVAMAQMRADGAYPDLLEILTVDDNNRVRNDAVYGMARLSPPQLMNDLRDAHGAGRISRRSASWHIAYCEPSDEWLVSLLNSKEIDDRKLGCAVIDAMVRENTPMRCPGLTVTEPVKLCLEASEHTMTRKRRERLLQWIGEART